MRRIVAAVFQSLDGVMQAPGGPTEDWTGGFTLGGWTAPYADETTGKAIAALHDGPFDLLLGRKTYEIFAGYWPYVDESNPIGEAFDKAAKYVVTGGDDALEWQNSHRLGSIAAVADLKAGEGPDLIIWGSSTLYPQLFSAGLIDRLVLMTYPVVLGKGKRLFGDGTPAFSMTVVSQETSPEGVVVATLEPAGEVRTGTFAGPDTSEREKGRQERMKREG